MSISPARTAAFDILLRVEQLDAYASELLHSSRYAKLSPADHGLATELVMGVLRWRSRLDGEIGDCSAKPVQKVDPEVLAALRLAAYQLLFLDRVPGRAAVHESVELVKRAGKRSAAAFANAVLRKLAGKRSVAEAFTGKKSAIPAVNRSVIKSPESSANQSGSSAADLSQAWAHPLWLVERWVRQFGIEAAREICEYDQRAPGTAIHIYGPDAEEELKASGVELDPGRLVTSARRVRNGRITATRAFSEGRVAIQDEASQLVALLVGRGSRILDCCAAPGGKTRLLAEHNPQSRVVAVELHRHRARLLQKLVSAPNLEVINADIITWTATQAFDRVLVDAPCSGTGALARNPEIKWRLKPGDLADLQVRQLAILRAAMRHVARGGRLVYSTCSLEREENQEVVEKTLSSEPSFRVLEMRTELERLRIEGELAWQDAASLVDGPFLRTLPGVHPSEGFFVVVLEKI
jgi:16S rRNA (cytosine967-C5)-methyltransferase